MTEEQNTNDEPASVREALAEAFDVGAGAPDPISEPTAPEPADEPADAPAIAPPASWSAAAKADFAALPPHIREEVKKREDDFEKGLAQQSARAARLNRLDAVLGPRSERFRLNGIDEAQALQMLFAAQDFLERDPINALIYLGRQSGVDLRALTQAPSTTGQAQGAPQPPPAELAGLAAQVQTLTEAMAAQSQAAHEARLEGQIDQINAFAADPRHLYFENVRDRMTQIISAGQAAGLDDAYEQACWSDPAVRPLMLKAEAQAQAEAQKAKAAAARHASGSVTGSPAPGAKPGRSGPPPSLREALDRAFDFLA